MSWKSSDHSEREWKREGKKGIECLIGFSCLFFFVFFFSCLLRYKYNCLVGFYWGFSVSKIEYHKRITYAVIRIDENMTAQS